MSEIIILVIGFLWFRPSMFYKVWLAGWGRTWEERPLKTTSPILLGTTIIAYFLEVVILALILNAMGSKTAGSGILGGFLLWLGFVASTGLVSQLFASHNSVLAHGWKVWLVTAGNFLIDLLVVGTILGVWH